LVVLHDRRKELEQAREELIKKNKQLLAKTGNQKKEVTQSGTGRTAGVTHGVTAQKSERTQVTVKRLSSRRQ
jgi:hypothetical protein